MNMKKITALAAAASLAVCMLSACGSNPNTPAETEPAAAVETVPAAETNAPETPAAPGGGSGESHAAGSWSMAESTEVTPERQEVFDRAKEGLDGVGYTPEAYLASQPAAGTNHCYLCRAQTVIPNAQPYYTLVFVYEDPNGGSEIAGFHDLTEAPSDSTAAGGWSAPESSEITEDLQAVMDTACEVYDGATLVPIALLEEQVVAGMNYLFLCRVEGAGTETEPYYALVKVFADLAGGAEITNIEELVIGALWNSSTK